MSYHPAEEIVAQLFEKLDYFVRRNLQYKVNPTEKNSGTSDIDLLILSAQPLTYSMGLPFILASEEHLRSIRRASIGVTAGLTTPFTPARLTGKNSEKFYHFAKRKQARDEASRMFGSSDFLTVLILPNLGGTEKSRVKGSEIIRDQGVDHVLLLPTVVELLWKLTSVNDTFCTDVVQTIRMLKMKQNTLWCPRDKRPHRSR